MATYYVHIYTNPVEGRDADFHEWYQNTHLDDVLQTAGFSAAQRFSLDAQMGMPMPNGHLAIYEGEGESAQEVLDRLNSTRDQRDMSGADVIDGANAALWVLSAAGERVER